MGTPHFPRPTAYPAGASPSDASPADASPSDASRTPPPADTGREAPLTCVPAAERSLRARSGNTPTRRWRGETTPPCHHRRYAIGPLEADVCPGGGVAWIDGDEPLDPAVAMAHLFGQFPLAATVDALRAPGPTVFVYRPVGRRGRRTVGELPTEWIEAAPGLWISGDGDRNLLMCPSDPVLAANLLRRL